MSDDPDRLVTVTSAATEFAANVAVAVLADHGIEAKAFAGLASWWGVGGPGKGSTFWNIPVQVRARDLERARAALTENKRDSVDIDWDAVELGDREDDAPLTPIGHTPMIVRVAIWLGLALMLAALIAGIVLSLR
ncbi:MAG: hypothetical protein MK101_00960 [Phycisphaerales bacterium]|nr:hypothetical protein [Phycisphaerales bacterium]